VVVSRLCYPTGLLRGIANSPMNRLSRSVSLFFLSAWLLIHGSVVAGMPQGPHSSNVFEAFAEPIRKINLASDEVGAIFELLVEEGQTVSKGQVVARLDSRLQLLQLEIATQMAANRSHLQAAEEELRKRSEIHQKLQRLRDQGHASHSEIIRAELELSIANYKLQSAREEMEVRELERKRAEVQLQRRTVAAPFDAVVTKIHTREGEYLSPVKPEIVSLAQIDQLTVRLNVPLSSVSAFKSGLVFNVQLSSGRTVLATVQQVGIEINAESETVEVKLVIENPNHELRSGEKVTLSI
jgi:RND family efflux transporter MFP subunit